VSFKFLPPGNDFDFLVVPPFPLLADQREARHRPVLGSLSLAESPCFHSHSRWSGLLRCQLGFSIQNGCCHLGIELNVSVSGNLRSAVTSQSPELGDGLVTSLSYAAMDRARLFRNGS
jgi:hypothetical protein